MHAAKKEYLEGREEAIRNNIPLRTYRFRLQSGWTIKEASTLPRYTRVNQMNYLRIDYMNCPICNSEVKLLDVRQNKFKIAHRKYECKECLTEFKTEEKIIFNSIPSYLRNKYLEDGKFK